jgi:hypothetical protein
LKRTTRNKSVWSKALIAATACAAATAGLVGTLAGCPSTATTTLYTPITGLVIDSATLLTGLGCGTAPTQVYKYAAIVNLQPDAGSELGLPVSGVFDCFSNGQFSNLPTPDGNTTNYVITVYAWNQASFPEAELGQCDYLNVDASCPGENPKTIAKYAAQATWTTTCTASQVQGVTEVAVCGTLLRTSDASLEPDVGTDAPEDDGNTDAGEAGAGEAGGDAGDAGSPGEGGDAGEAGPSDGASGNEAGDAGIGDSGEPG